MLKQMMKMEARDARATERPRMRCMDNIWTSAVWRMQTPKTGEDGEAWYRTLT